MSELLLSAEGVGKRFGRNQVLKSASFWVHAGRITALMGRNGSGKTTLLRCGLGELRMDHGLVRVMGEVEEKPRLWRLAGKGVWFMDQDGQLPSTWPVEKLLDVTARRMGSNSAPWVELLRLAEFIESEVPQLSRGERKRLCLALAMVSRARCLVLDEPFEGIDPQDKELVAHCLREAASRGAGVVVTGHDARALLKVADTITWCVSGTTHDLGSAEAAKDHAQFVREYLGPGYDSP